MTLLPNLRDQLEAAAIRHARTSIFSSTREQLVRALEHVGSERRIPLIALAVSLAALLFTALNMSPHSHPAAAVDPQPIASVGMLTPTPAGANGRPADASYVQGVTTPLADMVATHLHAQPVPRQGKAEAISVGFTSRVTVPAARGAYALVVHAPHSGDTQLFSSTQSGGARAGQSIVLSIGAPRDGTLSPGAYAGAVVLRYTSVYALVEGGETAYIPVGSFTVHVG